MSKDKLVTTEGDRSFAPLKAAALIALMAVIALVVVSVDAPRMVTAPDAPLARVADAFLTADGPATATPDTARTTAATTPSDLHAAATTSEYFPSRFGAPKSAPEEPVSTF